MVPAQPLLLFPEVRDPGLVNVSTPRAMFKADHQSIFVQRGVNNQTHPQFQSGLFFKGRWGRDSSSPPTQMGMGGYLKKKKEKQIEALKTRTESLFTYDRFYNTLKWKFERKYSAISYVLLCVHTLKINHTQL